MTGGDVPEHAVTVLRKKWDTYRLEYVADYRCGACGRTFRRRFHSGYPDLCPRCMRPLGKVNGKIGDGTWRRRVS